MSADKEMGSTPYVCARQWVGTGHSMVNKSHFPLTILQWMISFFRTAAGAGEWTEGFSAPVLHSLCIWEAKQKHLPGLASTRKDSDCLQFTRRLREYIFRMHCHLLLPITALSFGLCSFPDAVLVLLAMQGTTGAVYCVLISSLGLLSSPFCDTGSGNYTYAFKNNTPEWVAFMALGLCSTSKDDTADDQRVCALSTGCPTVRPVTSIHTQGLVPLSTPAPKATISRKWLAKAWSSSVAEELSHPSTVFSARAWLH